MQNCFNFIINEKVDLPAVYNETKIVIIPRDIDVFFIYWDVSSVTKKDLCNKGIACSFFIRVRNIDIDKCFYVFHPDVFTRSWYFDVSYTDLSRKAIVSDIGVYDNFGKFLVLASSNVINLPNKFYFGKDYYYWYRKKESKRSNVVPIKNWNLCSIQIHNISSREFFNSGNFIKSIKR